VILPQGCPSTAAKHEAGLNYPLMNGKTPPLVHLGGTSGTSGDNHESGKLLKRVI